MSGVESMERQRFTRRVQRRTAGWVVKGGPQGLLLARCSCAVHGFVVME